MQGRLRFTERESDLSQRNTRDVMGRETLRGRDGTRVPVTLREMPRVPGPQAFEQPEERLKNLAPGQSMRRKVIENTFHEWQSYFRERGEDLPQEAVFQMLNLPRELGKTLVIAAHDDRGRVISMMSAVHHEPSKTALLGYVWTHPDYRGHTLETNGKTLAQHLAEQGIQYLQDRLGAKIQYAEIERDAGEADQTRRIRAFSKWDNVKLVKGLDYHTPGEEDPVPMHALVVSKENKIPAKTLLEGIRANQSLVYGHLEQRALDAAFEKMQASAKRRTFFSLVSPAQALAK